MYHRDAEASETDARRSGWTEHGFADLCGYRLAKVLIDAGVPAKRARYISGENEIWKLQNQHQRAEELGEPVAEEFLIFGDVQGDPWWDVCFVEQLAEFANGQR